VVYERYGNAYEVCRVVKNVPVPEVKPGFVIVKQESFSINPVDYKFILGNLSIVEATRSFPIIPGFDVAGTIVQTAPGSRFSIGDKVLGYQSVTLRACCAENVSIAETNCVLRPDNITDAQAGGVPLVGVTSWQSLKLCDVSDRSKILILGGTTATGIMGIQIAVALGATVLTTCSSRNSKIVTELGANEFCDYHEEKWWEKWANAGITAIYDCVGGYESWEKAQTVLGPEGKFVTIAGDRQDKLGPVRLLDTGRKLAWRKMGELVGKKPKYVLHTAFPDTSSLQAVADLISEGKVRPMVDSTFSFTQSGVCDAFRKLMAGRCVGKVVILVGDKEEEGSVEDKNESPESVSEGSE